MKHLLAITMTLATTSFAGDSPALFDAIRSGDISKVKAHLTKAELDSRDQRGATPLMHAAAFGNIETLRLLLDAGADVNARNHVDATALLWAAGQPDKARLLMERGADINVQSKRGRTPLMVAAARRGNSAIVAMMLSKGADAKARDRLGVSVLSLAALAGDIHTVKLLLRKGADPTATNAIGVSSLFAAAMGHNPEIVRLVLQHGADVNAATNLPPAAATRTTNNIRNGPPTNSKVTPLHNAAANGPVESVQYLLKAGANVNARDGRQLVPLTFALATEYPSLEIVRTLIEAGADVNVPDNFSDTPLDWAEKFGNPEVIAELKRAGAKHGRDYQAPQPSSRERLQPAVALERATKLLEDTSVTFFKGSGCVSCHHQNVIARARSAANRAGIGPNDAVVKEQILQMKSQWVNLQEDFLQAILPGGGANRLAENLLGLKAANYPADSITDAAVAAIALSQDPEGSWGSGEVQHRPPIAQSPFSATARIVRVLRDYPIPARRQEFEQRIARARAWLMKAKPVTSEDFSMRLAGLKDSEAPPKEVRKAATALLALQRADGGWGANPNMKGDAYATGVALTALVESNVLAITESAYRRGVGYLLSTQFPDGSWYVRSRSIKFQPYFESGFPFGHDQWISTAATAWAVQAIAPGLRAPTVSLSAQKKLD